MSAELAGAVTRIAEHFGAWGFVVEQAGGGVGVTNIARAEIALGDQTGLGLGSNVGLVAVAIRAAGLVGVAGLGVNGRNDPVLGGAASDALLVWPVARLDVLARDQREQRHGVGLLVAQHGAGSDEVLGCPHQLVGVIDQLRHQAVAIGGIFPITRGPARLEVVLTDPHRSQCRDQPADPAGLADQHLGLLRGPRLVVQLLCEHWLVSVGPGLGELGWGEVAVG